VGRVMPPWYQTRNIRLRERKGTVMAIFRAENGVYKAQNEWAEYIISGDSDHWELTIRVLAPEYDNSESLKDMAGAIDGWFYVQRMLDNEFGDEDDDE